MLGTGLSCGLFMMYLRQIHLTTAVDSSTGGAEVLCPRCLPEAAVLDVAGGGVALRHEEIECSQGY